MAWIRVGDTFNQAKEWTRAAELAIMRKDERLVDELKGVALSLYFQSAVSWSDYEISLGAAAIIIRQSRFDRVIADLKTIGVLSDLPPIDGVPRWKLLERKDFVHIIKERESSWRPNASEMSTREASLFQSCCVMDQPVDTAGLM